MRLQHIFLLGSLLALLLGSVPATAKGRIERHTISSAILTDSERGADLEIAIYLPEGYDTSELRYPVVYLLHGGGTEGPAHILGYPGNAPRSADALIANNQIQPLILAIPRVDTNCNCRSLAREQYMVQEVVPFVDANYRTIPTRSARAIAGWSRGGAHALFTAMTHPHMFSMVGAYASAGFYRDSPTEWLFSAHEQHRFPLRFWIYLGTSEVAPQNSVE